MVAQLPGSSGRFGTAPVSGSAVISTGFVSAGTYAQIADNPASPTAATALAGSGTIPTTQGVQRVSPASAVTGIILAAGVSSGQHVVVINEATTANSLAFAASGTSNVSGGISIVIFGGQAQEFVWNSVTALWYPLVDSTTTGFASSGQSATAPAVATSGTITTAGIGVSRVSPAGAVTGVILQAGTVPGQVCTVVNEATGANSVTFAAAGTSNVADGVSAVIAGLRQMTFVWDSGTSLWYH